MDRADAILTRFSDKNLPLLGAEIGVLKGENALRLLSSHDKLILHLIDTWEPFDEDSRYRKTNDPNSGWDKATWDSFYAEVVSLAEKYLGRVFIHKGRSIEIATQFEDNLFDFIFIDADHSFEGCCEDILAWWPKVKNGGWLCGHDYNAWPGVTEAVDKWSKENNFEVIFDDDYTWFVQKKI